MVNKIKIVAFGKIKEEYLKNGVIEYQKRIKPFSNLEIIELKDENIPSETKKIIPHLTNDAYVLDEKGKELNSLEFADLLKKNDSLTFIIGGPNGIDDSLKKQAISLSKMTFVHEMARLILLEQIYRGFMIINNRKYHK